MKRFRSLVPIFFVVALAALPAIGQQRQGATSPPASSTPAQSGGTTAIPAKIAFVNTEEFKDEKKGILRWISAAKTLQNEFEPLQSELLALENRIQALSKEVQTLSGSAVVDRKSIVSKQEDLARLQREQKFKKDEGEANFKKRYEALVGPVSADIGKALDVFAKQRGITLLLDYNRMVEIGAILSADNSTDLTAAFIAEYNSKNPASAPILAPGR